MKHFLLPLLLAPLFGHTFPYSPEEGAEYSVLVNSSLILEMTGMTVLVTQNGEESELPVPPREQSASNIESISYTDTISNLEGGNPTQIAREFTECSRVEALRIRAEGQEDVDHEREATTPFEGQTVLFSMDEDGEWDALLKDDEDFDAEALDKLEPHFGFLGFLPEGAEAELGDEWDVPLEAFIEFRTPTGSLSFVFNKKSPFPLPYTHLRAHDTQATLVCRHIPHTNQQTHTPSTFTYPP